MRALCWGMYCIAGNELKCVLISQQCVLPIYVHTYFFLLHFLIFKWERICWIVDKVILRDRDISSCNREFNFVLFITCFNNAILLDKLKSVSTLITCAYELCSATPIATKNVAQYCIALHVAHYCLSMFNSFTLQSIAAKILMNCHCRFN